ncbi:MAG: tRNA preQ1(34) S-adenosylmethionine ribosyltransferase-isomerase QueA [Candidatus Aminicenantes bacterium RBG_16_63_14]|nr:MAG: tRNA preQ1(34) S-adenosylmethionine ribosyltransferase-isomerase QueA [Candidatus Aminicenantes bacterium RBG_16_63_14]OGD29486.1 MAG: tRNA preQ1(34) S-adenosylmethionine ribosyltransferase-isomerase QueA [Candidatus Aminicenantes bacterium RBG_19FT_COMBO_65_30]
MPPGLIAQHPLPRRDDSRMMVVDRITGSIRHELFRDFAGHMRPSDLLVLNDTKVIPARVWGKSGEAIIEFLFLKELGPGLWEALGRPARRVRRGDVVHLGPRLEARVEEVGEEGKRVLRFDNIDVRTALNNIGYAPLPPYIKRSREDRTARSEDLARYQTVFARKEGAVAAPTAGLHFTKKALLELKTKGVDVRHVTLDVGLATFQPVRAEIVLEHKMLEEWYSVSPSTARDINTAKAEVRPVTAVGTTVVRTLESAWRDGRVLSGRRATSLFIYPGFEFHAVDRLLTNFHLPKSTLLMLVAAFAGRDLIIRAYREAVHERYRFFSYGDCMLIL